MMMDEMRDGVGMMGGMGVRIALWKAFGWWLTALQGWRSRNGNRRVWRWGGGIEKGDAGIDDG